MSDDTFDRETLRHIRSCVGPRLSDGSRSHGYIPHDEANLASCWRLVRGGHARWVGRGQCVSPDHAIGPYCVGGAMFATAEDISDEAASIAASALDLAAGAKRRTKRSLVRA